MKLKCEPFAKIGFLKIKMSKCIRILTVVWVELVDVLVTTFIVDDGVVVTTVVLFGVVVCVVSLVDVELLLDLDVDVDVVVSVVVGAWVVTVVVFGIRESTMPIGPDKSTSLSGHVNSSG